MTTQFLELLSSTRQNPILSLLDTTLTLSTTPTQATASTTALTTSIHAVSPMGILLGIFLTQTRALWLEQHHLEQASFSQSLPLYSSDQRLSTKHHTMCSMGVDIGIKPYPFEIHLGKSLFFPTPNQTQNFSIIFSKLFQSDPRVASFLSMFEPSTLTPPCLFVHLFPNIAPEVKASIGLSDDDNNNIHLFGFAHNSPKPDLIGGSTSFPTLVITADMLIEFYRPIIFQKKDKGFMENNHFQQHPHSTPGDPLIINSTPHHAALIFVGQHDHSNTTAIHPPQQPPTSPHPISSPILPILMQNNVTIIHSFTPLDPSPTIITPDCYLSSNGLVSPTTAEINENALISSLQPTSRSSSPPTQQSTITTTISHKVSQQLPQHRKSFVESITGGTTSSRMSFTDLVRSKNSEHDRDNTLHALYNINQRDLTPKIDHSSMAWGVSSSNRYILDIFPELSPFYHSAIFFRTLPRLLESTPLNLNYSKRIRNKMQLDGINGDDSEDCGDNEEDEDNEDHVVDDIEYDDDGVVDWDQRGRKSKHKFNIKQITLTHALLRHQTLQYDLQSSLEHLIVPDNHTTLLSYNITQPESHHIQSNFMDTITSRPTHQPLPNNPTSNPVAHPNIATKRSSSSSDVGRMDCISDIDTESDLNIDFFEHFRDFGPIFGPIFSNCDAFFTLDELALLNRDPNRFFNTNYDGFNWVIGGVNGSDYYGTRSGRPSLLKIKRFEQHNLSQQSFEDSNVANDALRIKDVHNPPRAPKDVKIQKVRQPKQQQQEQHQQNLQQEKILLFFSQPNLHFFSTKQLNLFSHFHSTKTLDPFKNDQNNSSAKPKDITDSINVNNANSTATNNSHTNNQSNINNQGHDDNNNYHNNKNKNNNNPYTPEWHDMYGSTLQHGMVFQGFNAPVFPSSPTVPSSMIHSNQVNNLPLGAINATLHTTPIVPTTPKNMTTMNVSPHLALFGQFEETIFALWALFLNTRTTLQALYHKKINDVTDSYYPHFQFPKNTIQKKLKGCYFSLPNYSSQLNALAHRLGLNNTTTYNNQHNLSELLYKPIGIINWYYQNQFKTDYIFQNELHAAQKLAMNDIAMTTPHKNKNSKPTRSKQKHQPKSDSQTQQRYQSQIPSPPLQLLQLMRLFHILALSGGINSTMFHPESNPEVAKLIPFLMRSPNLWKKSPRNCHFSSSNDLNNSNVTQHQSKLRPDLDSPLQTVAPPLDRGLPTNHSPLNSTLQSLTQINPMGVIPAQILSMYHSAQSLSPNTLDNLFGGEFIPLPPQSTPDSNPKINVPRVDTKIITLGSTQFRHITYASDISLVISFDLKREVRYGIEGITVVHNSHQPTTTATQPSITFPPSPFPAIQPAEFSIHSGIQDVGTLAGRGNKIVNTFDRVLSLMDRTNDLQQGQMLYSATIPINVPLADNSNHTGLHNPSVLQNTSQAASTFILPPTYYLTIHVSTLPTTQIYPTKPQDDKNTKISQFSPLRSDEPNNTSLTSVPKKSTPIKINRHDDNQTDDHHRHHNQTCIERDRVLERLNKFQNGFYTAAIFHPIISNPNLFDEINNITAVHDQNGSDVSIIQFWNDDPKVAPKSTTPSSPSQSYTNSLTASLLPSLHYLHVFKPAHRVSLFIHDLVLPYLEPHCYVIPTPQRFFAQQGQQPTSIIPSITSTEPVILHSTSIGILPQARITSFTRPNTQFTPLTILLDKIPFPHFFELLKTAKMPLLTFFVHYLQLPTLLLHSPKFELYLAQLNDFYHTMCKQYDEDYVKLGSSESKPARSFSGNSTNPLVGDSSTIISSNMDICLISNSGNSSENNVNFGNHFGSSIYSKYNNIWSNFTQFITSRRSSHDPLISAPLDQMNKFGPATGNGTPFNTPLRGSSNHNATPDRPSNMSVMVGPTSAAITNSSPLNQPNIHSTSQSSTAPSNWESDFEDKAENYDASNISRLLEESTTLYPFAFPPPVGITDPSVTMSKTKEKTTPTSTPVATATTRISRGNNQGMTDMPSVARLPTPDDLFTMVQVQVVLWIVQYLLPFSLHEYQSHHLRHFQGLREQDGEHCGGVLPPMDLESNNHPSEVFGECDGCDSELERINLQAQTEYNDLLHSLLMIDTVAIVASPWLSTQLYFAFQYILFSHPLPRATLHVFPLPGDHDSPTPPDQPKRKPQPAKQPFKPSPHAEHNLTRAFYGSRSSGRSQERSFTTTHCPGILLLEHHVLPFSWNIVTLQSPEYHGIFNTISDIEQIIQSLELGDGWDVSCADHDHNNHGNDDAHHKNNNNNHNSTQTKKLKYGLLADSSSDTDENVTTIDLLEHNNGINQDNLAMDLIPSDTLAFPPNYTISLSITPPPPRPPTLHATLHNIITSPFTEYTYGVTMPTLQAIAYQISSLLNQKFAMAMQKLTKIPQKIHFAPNVGLGVSTGQCGNSLVSTATCLYSCFYPLNNPTELYRSNRVDEKSSSKRSTQTPSDPEVIFHMTLFINSTFISTTAPFLTHMTGDPSLDWGVLGQNLPLKDPQGAQSIRNCHNMIRNGQSCALSTRQMSLSSRYLYGHSRTRKYAIGARAMQSIKQKINTRHPSTKYDRNGMDTQSTNRSTLVLNRQQMPSIASDYEETNLWECHEAQVKAQNQLGGNVTQFTPKKDSLALFLGNSNFPTSQGKSKKRETSPRRDVKIGETPVGVKISKTRQLSFVQKIYRARRIAHILSNYLVNGKHGDCCHGNTVTGMIDQGDSDAHLFMHGFYYPSTDINCSPSPPDMTSSPLNDVDSPHPKGKPGSWLYHHAQKLLLSLRPKMGQPRKEQQPPNVLSKNQTCFTPLKSPINFYKTTPGTQLYHAFIHISTHSPITLIDPNVLNYTPPCPKSLLPTTNNKSGTAGHDLRSGPMVDDTTQDGTPKHLQTSQARENLIPADHSDIQSSQLHSLFPIDSPLSDPLVLSYLHFLTQFNVPNQTSPTARYSLDCAIDLDRPIYPAAYQNSIFTLFNGLEGFSSKFFSQSAIDLVLIAISHALQQIHGVNNGLPKICHPALLHSIMKVTPEEGIKEKDLNKMTKKPHKTLYEQLVVQTHQRDTANIITPCVNDLNHTLTHEVEGDVKSFSIFDSHPTKSSPSSHYNTTISISAASPLYPLAGIASPQQVNDLRKMVWLYETICERAALFGKMKKLKTIYEKSSNQFKKRKDNNNNNNNKMTSKMSQFAHMMAKKSRRLIPNPVDLSSGRHFAHKFIKLNSLFNSYPPSGLISAYITNQLPRTVINIVNSAIQEQLIDAQNRYNFLIEQEKKSIQCHRYLQQQQQQGLSRPHCNTSRNIQPNNSIRQEQNMRDHIKQIHQHHRNKTPLPSNNHKLIPYPFTRLAKSKMIPERHQHPPIHIKARLQMGRLKKIRRSTRHKKRNNNHSQKIKSTHQSQSRLTKRAISLTQLINTNHHQIHKTQLWSAILLLQRSYTSRRRRFAQYSTRMKALGRDNDSTHSIRHFEKNMLLFHNPSAQPPKPSQEQIVGNIDIPNLIYSTNSSENLNPIFASQLHLFGPFQPFFDPNSPNFTFFDPALNGSLDLYRHMLKFNICDDIDPLGSYETEKTLEAVHKTNQLFQQDQQHQPHHRQYQHPPNQPGPTLGHQSTDLSLDSELSNHYLTKSPFGLEVRADSGEMMMSKLNQSNSWAVLRHLNTTLNSSFSNHPNYQTSSKSLSYNNSTGGKMNLSGGSGDNNTDDDDDGENDTVVVFEPTHGLRFSKQ